MGIKLFNRKKGNLTQGSLLKENGINLNSLSFIEDTKRAYVTSFKKLDINQCCNKYKWKNLPNGITSWLIENLLYWKGSLVAFYMNGQLMLLPYANTGQLDVYGLPTKVQPVAYNGQTIPPTLANMEIPIDINGSTVSNGVYEDGTPINNCGGVILYDEIPIFKGNKPLAKGITNEQVLNDMSEILARVKNNIKNSDKKIVFYCESENQKRVFYESIKNSFNCDDNFIVMVKPKSIDGLESEPFHTDVELQTQSLLECFQSLNNIRCMLNGISNDGVFEKKERKITGELDGQVEQTTLTMDSGLEMRKLFLKQLAIAYPEHAKEINKIKVYPSYQDYEDKGEIIYEQ